MKYFKDKTAEQTFSFCLLISCVAIMLFCAIVRLCGGLWFAADLDGVPVPNEFWQDRIMNVLLAFELTFVYKILCRTKWIWCILIAIAQTVIIIFLPNETIANIVNLVLYFIIPLIFTRQWQTIIDTIFIYLFGLCYSLLFLAGRIGNIKINSAYIFTYNALGTIDYKLFFVALYLFIKNFGGIRLWKTQKRLIFQKDLKTNAK